MLPIACEHVRFVIVVVLLYYTVHTYFVLLPLATPKKSEWIFQALSSFVFGAPFEKKAIQTAAAVEIPQTTSHFFTVWLWRSKINGLPFEWEKLLLKHEYISWCVSFVLFMTLIISSALSLFRTNKHLHTFVYVAEMRLCWYIGTFGLL